MKRLVAILSALLLCLVTLNAFCQVKGDFSDWHVPPPLPPGTIPKSPTARNTTTLTFSDVNIPFLGDIFKIKLVSAPTATDKAPEVEAPEQPKFPSLPFSTPDIPLPQVPQQTDLPKETPHDQLVETFTDMPQPAAPDLPETPKMPDVKGSENLNENDLKAPVTPDIITQPAIAMPAADSFPFIEWPLPAIPETVVLSAAITGNNQQVKKPAIKNNANKRRRGG